MIFGSPSILSFLQYNTNNARSFRSNDKDSNCIKFSFLDFDHATLEIVG